jgi:hypothetical protein
MTAIHRAHLNTEVPEADLLEQQAPVAGDDRSDNDATTAPDTTALSQSLVDEADLLEQAAVVGAESDDDYDHD